jgi:hypothetical protein
VGIIGTSVPGVWDGEHVRVTGVIDSHPGPWLVAAVAVALVAACTDSSDNTAPGSPSTQEVAAPTSERREPAGSTSADTDSSSAPTASVPSEAATVPPPPTTALEPIGPSIDPQLAQHIPEVEGYTATPGLPAAYLWDFYDLPDELSVHPALITTNEGDELGRLVVAAAPDGTSPIDLYAVNAFAEPIGFVADATYDETTDQTILATNTDLASWANVDGAAVITASIPDQDAFQWAWSADGLLWIVRGTAAAEGYVRALLAEQLPSIAPFDQQGMLGDLYDHTPIVDGYTYLDLPRVGVLDSLPYLTIPDCFAHVYLGYIRPTGQPVTPMQPSDLGIGIYDLSDACVDSGYLDHLRAALDTQGWAPAQIAGIPVLTDVTNVAVLDDDLLIHLRTDDPATLQNHAAFIESFLTNQP